MIFGNMNKESKDRQRLVTLAINGQREFRIIFPKVESLILSG